MKLKTKFMITHITAPLVSKIYSLISTYLTQLCEQLYSVINSNKAVHRSSNLTPFAHSMCFFRGYSTELYRKLMVLLIFLI